MRNARRNRRSQNAARRIRAARTSYRFDFALAQSIFSHCGLDLIKGWLSAISRSLASNGALVATFLIGEEDSAQTGWIYPECVNYRPATLERAAENVNLRFEILGWKHPRQTWALFAAPGLIPLGSRTALLLGTQDWKERSARSISRERRANFCDATQGGRCRRLLLLPHDGTPQSRSHRGSGLGFAWSSR